MHHNIAALSPEESHVEPDSTDLSLISQWPSSVFDFALCSDLELNLDFGSTSNLFTEYRHHTKSSTDIDWTFDPDYGLLGDCDQVRIPDYSCASKPNNFFVRRPSSSLAISHCGLQPDVEALERSDSIARGLPLRQNLCEHCDKSFGWPSQLKKHRKIHHENYRSHRCQECDQAFHYRKDLKRHRLTKHQSLEEVLHIYKCPIGNCQMQKDFIRKDKFKEHMQRQHPAASTKELQDHLATFGGSMPSFSLLLPSCYQSGQQHAIKKPHKCPFKDCSRTDGFASHVDLCRHLRSVHNALLPADASGFYRCVHEGCKSSTKIYSRKDNFKRHVNAVHPHVDCATDLIEQ